MKPSHLKELYLLFPKIRTSAEAKQVLHDLLTPAELGSIAERWQLIKELMRGTPQRAICKKLKISIAKITRGSHALKKTAGGFRLLRDR